MALCSLPCQQQILCGTAGLREGEQQGLGRSHGAEGLETALLWSLVGEARPGEELDPRNCASFICQGEAWPSGWDCLSVLMLPLQLLKGTGPTVSEDRRHQNYSDVARSEVSMMVLLFGRSVSHGFLIKSYIYLP